MVEHKEIKRITAGFIFSWIFGVLFLIMGVGIIGQGSYFGGILIVLCSVMIIPYFNKLIRDKFNLEISGGIKFLLVIAIFILMGFSMANLSSSTETIVKPTENINSPQNVQDSQAPQTTATNQKVKSATINIDRVVETAANLGAIRITVTNTGDVSINPKFDVRVTKDSGSIICEDSPMLGIGSISAGEKVTDEIQIFVCTFEKDGTYDVTVDLLDENYNKLDTSSKDLEVNYWGSFGL